MEIAYLAGIFDGEGCANFYNTRNGRGKLHRYPRIIIVQSERNNGKELCERIKALHGGCIAHGMNKNTHMYRWTLQGKAVKGLLSAMLPYLIVKKERAMQMIECMA